ncbi:hypothetical protein SFUMM280S_06366 [Streptomyces fumanus]
MRERYCVTASRQPWPYAYELGPFAFFAGHDLQFAGFVALQQCAHRGEQPGQVAGALVRSVLRVHRTGVPGRGP